MTLKFYPAKHNSLFIWMWQHLNFLELSTKVKLNILPSEVKTLRSFSPNTGSILIANHSDELDPRVCMELSRRSGRRFTFMVNSEVYKEWFGITRWCLQFIGSFSVERGAFDQVAIKYAINTVKQSNETLVMFPEGEISNLNDSVQTFKPGVAHIGLEAIQEVSRVSPNWTVYVLPVAIKYRYRKNIGSTLRKRITRMEQHLAMHSNALGIRDELYCIMNRLKESSMGTDDTETEIMKVDVLIDQLQKTRESIISEIENKYHDPIKSHGDLLSRTQKMIFFLREQINKKEFFTTATQKQFKDDLKALKDTIAMATWQPQYIELNPSEERLAETVIKLEKVVFHKRRPPALGKREAFVRLLEPIDLSAWLAAYKEDPSTTSKNIAEELRAKIQQSILNMRNL